MSGQSGVPKRRNLILASPDAAESLEAAVRGLSSRSLVIIAGPCTVGYKGRASSRLTEGERLLIVKGDGSLLLHRPAGVEPVNWQPPGCRFKASLGPEGLLTIEATRPRPRETVVVQFKGVSLLSVLGLEDRGAFALHASEEEMKAAILLEPSLVEDGFRPLTSEKPVQSGFVDCVGRDREGRVTVVEIKRTRGHRAAVKQLAKYLDSMGLRGSEARGILAAPSISRQAETLLRDLHLDFRRLDPRVCAEVLRRRKGVPSAGLGEYLG